jgi:FkbM family methyltransferase
MMPRFLRALGRKVLDRYRFAWRQRLVKYVAAEDEQCRCLFRCDGPADVWRARTLFQKEPGTIAWIREAVRGGDVFYDIGANIGLYSLLAAHQVGRHGTVYSFEPHAANFHSLLHNIHLNGFNGRVRPLSVALHDRAGVFDFNYRDWSSGSSMSQLDSTRDAEENDFQPVISELKYAVTVDELVGGGMIRPPDHVKIDVDGNEMCVLQGMRKVLSGKHRPRSLQVEINARHKAQLLPLLEECGFELYQKHFTQLGQSMIAAGHDSEEIWYNALFRPRAAVLRAAS